MPGKFRSTTRFITTCFLVCIAILVLGSLEMAPMWVLIVAVVLAWVALIIVMIVEARKRPTLYYYDPLDEEWVPIEHKTEKEEQ